MNRYETLNEKLSKLELEITESQVKYDQMVELSRKKKDGSEEEDLDSYMKNLKQVDLVTHSTRSGDKIAKYGHSGEFRAKSQRATSTKVSFRNSSRI